MATGYMHPDYAHSLAEFGLPRELPRSKGWILVRQIDNTPYYDGMGCYPLFTCQDWSQLHSDVKELEGELVSLSLVTDPFGDYDSAYLKNSFKDVVYPFKEHFVVDLSCPMDSFVHPHHRRNARKSLRDNCVERCQCPIEFIDDWMSLYANLIQRHNITGIPAFSRAAFAKQLSIPGLIAFRAVHDEVTVGMTLWYIHADVGYYHLGAYSDIGYNVQASFALFWHAIEYFADGGLRWLNLGAGASIKREAADGLDRFKRGWSTGTRTAYFCGRNLNHPAYEKILNAKGLRATNDYFPAYRKGEFS